MLHVRVRFFLWSGSGFVAFVSPSWASLETSFAATFSRLLSPQASLLAVAVVSEDQCPADLPSLTRRPPSIVCFTARLRSCCWHRISLRGEKPNEWTLISEVQLDDERKRQGACGCRVEGQCTSLSRGFARGSVSVLHHRQHQCEKLLAFFHSGLDADLFCCEACCERTGVSLLQNEYSPSFLQLRL